MPTPSKRSWYVQAHREPSDLDGKLDDTCWKNAKPMELKVRSSASDKPDDTKTFGTQYKTTSMWSYDDKYLYIAFSANTRPA